MQYAAGLKAEILRFAEKYHMFDPRDKVLVAISGGADSVALTLLLCELAEDLGIGIAAAHLNHGLRGAESDRDEQFVRSFCQSNRIPLTTGIANIADLAASEGTGIEETARKARYRFLEEAALQCGCSKIATAHNADDNAETILINLIRGSGVRGLCGIPPVRGNIIRPLLCATRESIENYMSECGATFVIDSTNLDVAYTRNKIRHKVMPLLKEINPSFSEKALDTAELLRNDADYLDQLAEKYPLNAQLPLEIDCETLLGAGDSLAGRIVRRMVRLTGERSVIGSSDTELSKAHVDSVLVLAANGHPSGRVDLPKGISAKRIYGKITIGLKSDAGLRIESVLLSEGETRFGSWRIFAKLTDKEDCGNDRNAVCLRPELFTEGLEIRSIQTGDRISPAHRNWTKTLKKLYIEMKIPREERTGRPVIVRGGEICAIPGINADRKFVAGAPPMLKIIFRKD